jgi:PAS domain S-box-containing protein
MSAAKAPTTARLNTMRNVSVTGKERFFDDDDIIVSKTDLKGRITYANQIFLDIADYTEAEVLGQPHSMIRHPDMPRSIFKALWDTVQGGKEIFAYVINRTKHGDHYWVYAHVTPSLDSTGKTIGYHSNRRVPERSVLDKHIIPLYRSLKAEEMRHANQKVGLEHSERAIDAVLAERGMAYDEFVATLGQV